MREREREKERGRERARVRGKASLNVGCCVIPPRAPLLFLCLGPHVTVGYFLWWLARINRSSNVHPVSQQLHDWWDFTSLIYFIIVTGAWGEWRNGLCSMRNVTCDCRNGTRDYSNVRFVWGLCLISECQLLYESRQSVCCVSFWSQPGLMLHTACQAFTTKPVFSVWYLWIYCQREASCLSPFMANFASNDVMQRRNDALQVFGHCPPFFVQHRMSPRNVCWFNKTNPWSHFVSVLYLTQPTIILKTATHLPPVVARHCCCVIYFRKG